MSQDIVSESNPLFEIKDFLIDHAIPGSQNLGVLEPTTKVYKKMLCDFKIINQNPEITHVDLASHETNIVTATYKDILDFYYPKPDDNPSDCLKKFVDKICEYNQKLTHKDNSYSYNLNKVYKDLENLTLENTLKLLFFNNMTLPQPTLEEIKYLINIIIKGFDESRRNERTKAFENLYMNKKKRRVRKK